MEPRDLEVSPRAAVRTPQVAVKASLLDLIIGREQVFRESIDETTYDGSFVPLSPEFTNCNLRLFELFSRDSTVDTMSVTEGDDPEMSCGRQQSPFHSHRINPCQGCPTRS